MKRRRGRRARAQKRDMRAQRRQGQDQTESLRPMGMLARPPQQPDYRREEVPGYPDLSGGAFIHPGFRQGETYAKPGTGAPTYWHEMAHNFDAQVLNDGQRAQFAQLLGMDPNQPWYSGDNVGQVSASELFADAYATLAMQQTGRERYGAVGMRNQSNPTHVTQPNSSYGYDVPWKRHQRIAQLIYNAAGQHYDPQRDPYRRAKPKRRRKA